MEKLIHTSLTRIASFNEQSMEVQKIPVEDWSNGDYVVAEVTFPGSGELKIELSNGRMMDAMEGDILIGALGVRHATLEATGTWEKVNNDGKMHLLTGAGMFGMLTSKSAFVPEIIEIKYIGHVIENGRKTNMKDYVPNIPFKKFETPVILFVGTSMSAGKTTASRIFTRELKKRGYKVVAAKLSGAGRFKDILAVQDAGADAVFDFVDVGLPSSICPKSEYDEALKNLLSLLAAQNADIAVIEIGSSPLEPYNGESAIDMIKDHICFSVLAASDPYAVLGIMKSFEFKPDLVTGIATNTLGGLDLIKKLTGIRAINIIDPRTLPEVKELLFQKIDSFLVPGN